MALHGERLDRPTYTILQTELGEGNTAVCVRATHDVYGRDVVQKTVSLLGVIDAAARTEPALMNGLRHDHLVEVWEAQWDPEPLWKLVKGLTFVMPYYEGGSVHKALAEGHRFSVAEAVGVASGVLDALAYLHVDHRLLHRDVKPGNVFLDANRTHAYLGDLGSAVYMDADGTAAVHGGTPLYRPPEAALGRVGVPGDVYGVGMMLLEMLDGPLPYEDLDQAKVRERIAGGRPPVVARLLKPAPHVGKALRTVVASMIDPDPSRRPRTASEARRGLLAAAVVDWRPGPGDPPSSWEGRWPPGAGRHARVFQVVATPVTTGRYAGTVSLSARWRKASSAAWTGMASLSRRAADGDLGELRRFFDDIAVSASRMPTDR